MIFRSLRRLVLGACAAAFLLPLVPAAQAQYFGRNKVRYDNFDFRILETEHFDLYYDEGMETAAQDVGRMAERWYTRLSTILNHEYDERKAIVLYADDADFRQTNIANIGEGTQGVTEGLRQRVVLPMAGTYAETNHVLGHELVHQFQYDIAQRSERFGSFVRLPLFVIEGLAEYLSVGREDALTAMWMRDAVLRDDFPTITDLQRNPRYNEYQYGQPFWAHIAGTYGDEAAIRLFRTALEMPLDSAIVTVTGISPDSLSARWLAGLRSELVPYAANREVPVQPRTPEELDRIAAEQRERDEARARGERPKPRKFLAYPDSLQRHGARRLLATERNTGSMNIAPALSPDGTKIAYLSERDLFGIDLYLADAETGEVLQTLARVGTDAHTDALRFIESAGTWSPDGTQFAYVIFAGGDNEITILDVDAGKTNRRISVEGIGAIKDPSWSPDGTQISFTGIKNGISDLYVVDVQTNAVRQLTNDRFADLQATWRPDGKSLTFVTDRGPGTSFETMTFSQVRLATYDLETGAIEPMSIFSGAKHINPVWSPDGANLFFISDRGGFNDIFRMSAATGEIFQVTALATGVAGIADLSPALSIARTNGDLAYSIFEGQRYSVYRLAKEDAVGTPVERGVSPAPLAAVLPPGDALNRSLVTSYLADATTGLPPGTNFATKPFRSRLALDYVSQPSIGASYNPGYGSNVGVAGGISFLFSDQLSDKILGLTVQANGTFKDIGGQALFMDRGKRFLYGAQVGQIPILQVFYDADPSNSYFTRYYYRTYISQAQGILAYPLNTTQRAEVQGGFTRYGFDLEYDSYAQDPNDPRIIFQEGRRSVEGFDQPALNLGQIGGAFIGDYSNFGLTSPIRGGRYRFGVDGTLGTLNFGTVTADYRRYFFLRVPGMPRRAPVTFAVRGTHYGRYGDGASDDRLNPLYLGYGQFVRGYSSGSFDTDAEYGAYQSRLFGNKIGIGTAELRLPLLGVPQFGLISFPYLPTELVFFADAGMAWGQFNSNRGLFGTAFGEQRPVYSAGVSARVNVLGALILEPYYAFPFSRYETIDGVTGLPSGRGVFGINLTPGW